jgi:hypothetical protein
VASRNAGIVLAVSDLALIILAAPDESLDHEGMSPHLINDDSRTGSLGLWRMTGTGWVGAMLYRGLQSSSLETASKYSSTTCFLFDNRYRPAVWEIMADRVPFTPNSGWPVNPGIPRPSNVHGYSRTARLPF